MSVPLAPLSASLEKRRDGVADVHQRNFQHVERVHGWMVVYRWLDRWIPICSCGWVPDSEKDGWFLTEEAARESRCGRAV